MKYLVNLILSAIAAIVAIAGIIIASIYVDMILSILFGILSGYLIVTTINNAKEYIEYRKVEKVVILHFLANKDKIYAELERQEKIRKNKEIEFIFGEK